MTASADNYFANVAVITIAGASGTPTSETIAMAQEVEITYSHEEAIAWGFGSVLMQNRARYNVQVDVKIRYIKFLPQISSNALFYIMDPASGTGAVTDTNAVKLFTVTGQFAPMTTGNKTLLATVSNVTFKKLPFRASLHNWMEVNLEGIGQTVAYTNP